MTIIRISERWTGPFPPVCPEKPTLPFLKQSGWGMPNVSRFQGGQPRAGLLLFTHRKWLSEKKKTVPPPPPELQSCPPEWLWTMYGLICVLSTPGPSSPKWLQMNETNAQSKKPQPHIHPLPGNTSEGCPGAGRAGAELEPRPRSPATFPLPARRAASQPHLLPGPSERSLPALGRGSRRSQRKAPAPGRGPARGRSPLPQPPPGRSR